MTYLTVPSPQALDALAIRLAAPVAALFQGHDETGPDSQLADSLPVWSISTVVEGPGDLSAIAKPTRTWHHQVIVDGTPAAFARSLQFGGRLRLLSLTPSAIAERLDRTLAWVDENVSDDPELRLLEAPLNRVSALWVMRPGDPFLLVVDALPEADFPTGHRLLGEGEFLTGLRAAPVVQGRIRAD